MPTNSTVQFVVQLVVLLALGLAAYTRIMSRLAVLETKMDLLWGNAMGCKQVKEE